MTVDIEPAAIETFKNTKEYLAGGVLERERVLRARFPALAARERAAIEDRLAKRLYQDQ